MQSIRYVARRMIRSIGHSLMVTLSIALAIGLNLGVLTVTRSALSHSLGVPDEGRLVHYTLLNGDNHFAFSGPDYQALRDLASFKDVMAWKSDSFRIQEGSGLARVSGAFATGNAFSVLKLKPYSGRLLNESDDQRGGGPDGWAAVLGYSFWKTHFDARPDVIGQSITINGAPVHIVGVLPPQFAGIVPLLPTNILLPRSFQIVSDPDDRRFRQRPYFFEWIVLGRLPENLSLQGLQADLQSVEPKFRELADPGKLFADTPAGALINLEAGTAGLASSLKALRPPLLAMEALAASIFVFCLLNVVLLFSTRASREEQASAIRAALGARLLDELRLAITEAVGLTTIGCLLAVPMAFLTSRVLSLVVQSIHGFQSFATVSPGSSLLLAAVFSTLLCACVVVAVSCIRNGKKRAYISLKEGRGSTTRHSRDWVLGLELFACIVLITAAAINVVGFRKLAQQPSGFGDGGAVMVSLDLPAHPTTTSSKEEGASVKERIRSILDFIRTAPGVLDVGAINVSPLTNASAVGTVEVHGQRGSVQKLQVWPAEVSLGYFASSGTRIVGGRDFAADDLAGDPLCIVSARAASILYPGASPIDKIMHFDRSTSCRVVGIAENAHFKSMSDPADAVVYRLSNAALTTIVVRAKTSDLAIQAIRDSIKSAAPDTILTHIDTIQTYIEEDLRKWKIITLSGTFCAAIAAAVLSIGFFGILSLQVADRRREIGVQLALGASRVQVCRSLVRRIRKSLLVGYTLGSVGAMYVGAQLQQIYALDERRVIEGYCLSLALLAFLGVAAAAIPLRRALAVSPAECLTCE